VGIAHIRGEGHGACCGTLWTVDVEISQALLLSLTYLSFKSSFLHTHRHAHTDVTTSGQTQRPKTSHVVGTGQQNLCGRHGKARWLSSHVSVIHMKGVYIHILAYRSIEMTDGRVTDREIGMYVIHKQTFMQ